VPGRLHWGLYQLLKLTTRAYQQATGTLPTVRTHAPWLRSMRDERPEHSRGARISGAEKIVVVSVILAAILFEVWFFFFSGSSIGGGGGRCPRQAPAPGLGFGRYPPR
jgi:hypothetical protein